MNAKDFKCRRYLEELDFFFDEENNYWYHYGDINITNDFDVDVNIFIEGNFTVHGYCRTQDLTVTGTLFVKEYLSCNELSSFYLRVEETLVCKTVFVDCDMTVLGDVDVDCITVYGTITTIGLVDAISIQAHNFNFKNEVSCFNSLKSI